MRGEGAPNPIYEGEDGVIAWMLAGPDAEYAVPLPAPGERPRAILETYTEGALRRVPGPGADRPRVRPPAPDRPPGPARASARSSSTRATTRTRSSAPGSNDPEKYDPDASRETLDHSIMYILAVALEDGRWHHVDSYAPERAHRPSTVALWRKIRTVEDPVWTARYHEPDPARRAFGGARRGRLDDGSVVSEERLVADAHPNGRRPWRWPDYAEKLAQPDRRAAPGRAPASGSSTSAPRLGQLTPDEVRRLNPALPAGMVVPDRPDGRGIF